MRAIALSSTVLMLTSLASSSVFAQERGFRLPPHAQKIEDDAYYLGKTKDKGGKEVEGIAFLHPKERAAKGGGKPPGGSTSTCFSLMSSGARWKTIEPYVVDPSTSDPIGASDIPLLIAGCLSSWETASGRPIFGNEAEEVVNRSSIGQLNNVNEFMFGAIDDPGVIAVTIVWGRFSGPAQFRELVEWDMIFDEIDFTFDDATTDSSAMDFLNIFQHESGHAAGLSHPANTCINETMYAYATEGETKKRDLAAGDIAGIRALYR